MEGHRVLQQRHRLPAHRGEAAKSKNINFTKKEENVLKNQKRMNHHAF